VAGARFAPSRMEGAPMAETLNIREHMPVFGSDGSRVGTVDHLEGADRIKLTRADSDDDRHHFILTDWVDHVDAHVHLNMTTDEVKRLWE
jgi:hypothetical protein